MKTLLKALFALFALAILAPHVHAEGIAPADRLGAARAHICAYAPGSPECSHALSGKVSWFSPRRTTLGFEAGGKFDPGSGIWLADDIQTPAALAGFYLHEISHQEDREQGKCCEAWQCMDTERRAYGREFDYWRWVYGTWGTPKYGMEDHWTPWLNQFLWGDLTDRVSFMAAASCRNT